MCNVQVPSILDARLLRTEVTDMTPHHYAARDKKDYKCSCKASTLSVLILAV